MKKKITIVIAATIIVLSAFFLATSEPQGGQAQQEDSYIACGCGCCFDVQPQVECIYRQNGDDLQAIIAEDVRMSERPECENMGCFIPRKYVYCD